MNADEYEEHLTPVMSELTATLPAEAAVFITDNYSEIYGLIREVHIRAYEDGHSQGYDQGFDDAFEQGGTESTGYV
jgi:hypothetical protein